MEIKKNSLLHFVGCMHKVFGPDIGWIVLFFCKGKVFSDIKLEYIVELNGEWVNANAKYVLGL